MSKEISKNHDLCNFIVVQALRKNSLPFYESCVLHEKPSTSFKYLE